MRFPPLVPVLALAVVAGACDQGSAGPRLGAGARTNFLLAQGTGTGATASLIALADGDGGDGHHGGPNSIPVAAVKSLLVRVTGVKVVPLGDDSLEDRGAITLNAVHPVLLNLLTLPTDSGLLVMRGTLPAGTFGHLRLLFDSAAIVFSRTVTITKGPHTTTFPADSAFPLVIGGFGMPDTMNDHDADDANHFGIFVPATTITVGAADTTSTIRIVFDPTATLARVVVVHRGIRLVPVIVAARQPEPEDSAEDANEHGGNDHGNNGKSGNNGNHGSNGGDEHGGGD